MSRSVICYAQPGKAKSRQILEAFAAGCGGHLAGSYALERGPAAFYGVVGLEPLWRAVRVRGDYIYLDNAFFDAGRGTYYRAARNRLQDAPVPPDPGRLNALGVRVEPWRRAGRHIVVVMQSPHFMSEVAGWNGGDVGWQEWVLRKLQKVTRRQIVVRHWSRDKLGAAETLRDDFRDAWALVTHASAAANEAICAGIPVCVTDRSCVAAPMGTPLEQIEEPNYPFGREEWAARLAASQWTLDEMRAGMAWRALNA